MTKEQKIKTLKSMDAQKLWNAYRYYDTHFSPIDDDVCESLSLTVDEIMERLESADRAKNTEGK